MYEVSMCAASILTTASIRWKLASISKTSLFSHDRCPFMGFFRTLNPNPRSEMLFEGYLMIITDLLIWLGIKFRPSWPRTFKSAIKGLILAPEGPKLISDIVEGQCIDA